MRDRAHGRGGWLLLVPLILLAAVFLLPVALVLLNSFKSRLYISSAPFALPDALTFVGFENYLTGLNTAGFAAAFGRSLFITVGSVLLLVVGCSMTAWFIVRSRSRFCRVLRRSSRCSSSYVFWRHILATILSHRCCSNGQTRLLIRIRVESFLP